MPTLQEERTALIREFSNALPIADRNARRYRTLNFAIAITIIVSNLFAAFLTGDSALGGKTIAKKTASAITGKQPSELAPSWRYICGIAAACSLLAAISTGVNGVIKADEHRTKATMCSGKLAGLKFRMATDLSPSRGTIDEIRKAYETLQQEYREYLT